jgi:hypothetical protein
MAPYGVSGFDFPQDKAENRQKRLSGLVALFHVLIGFRQLKDGAHSGGLVGRSLG